MINLIIAILIGITIAGAASTSENKEMQRSLEILGYRYLFIYILIPFIGFVLPIIKNTAKINEYFSK